jgi:hypothetical protein
MTEAPRLQGSKIGAGPGDANVDEEAFQVVLVQLALGTAGYKAGEILPALVDVFHQPPGGRLDQGQGANPRRLCERKVQRHAAAVGPTD